MVVVSSHINFCNTPVIKEDILLLHYLLLNASVTVLITENNGINNCFRDGKDKDHDDINTYKNT